MLPCYQRRLESWIYVSLGWRVASLTQFAESNSYLLWTEIETMTMFPVAYDVVEGENAESWRWFIQLLQDDLCLKNDYGYTILSDQQMLS